MPNTYLDVYRAIGNREDLIDAITNISPDDTVFMSRIGKTTADNTKHEWLTESLQASNSANAVIEGASAAFASGDMTVRTRIANFCQIARRSFSTSYTQDEVKKAGVSGTEFDHQRMLKTKELAKDMNAAMISQASASGDSATARTLQGALAAIVTVTSDALSQPLQQGAFNLVLQTIWTQGGRPNAVYCNGGPKRTISGWTVPNTRTIDASGKTVVNSVMYYDSDFGRIETVLERELAVTGGLTNVMVTEEGKWYGAFLRPLFFEELGKQGGSRRGYVEAEFTLEFRAENANGKFINVASPA